MSIRTFNLHSCQCLGLQCIILRVVSNVFPVFTYLHEIVANEVASERTDLTYAPTQQHMSELDNIWGIRLSDGM